jgi:hypothetical protein
MKEEEQIYATLHQAWFGQYFSTFAAFCNLRKERGAN